MLEEKRGRKTIGKIETQSRRKWTQRQIERRVVIEIYDREREGRREREIFRHKEKGKIKERNSCY
jgi:hypothetical protein